MRTIWKFHLPGEDFPVIDMPAGSHVLSVGRQGSAITPTVWAEVDTTPNRVAHQFAIVGTGNPFPNLDGYTRCDFIGTAICGPLVWHVWDLGEVQ